MREREISAKPLPLRAAVKIFISSWILSVINTIIITTIITTVSPIARFHSKRRLSGKGDVRLHGGIRRHAAAALRCYQPERLHVAEVEHQPMFRGLGALRVAPAGQLAM